MKTYTVEFLKFNFFFAFGHISYNIDISPNINCIARAYADKINLKFPNFFRPDQVVSVTWRNFRQDYVQSAR